MQSQQGVISHSVIHTGAKHVPEPRALVEPEAPERSVPVPFENRGSLTHKEFPFVLCFSLQIIWQILFAWHCMSYMHRARA
jgi:hypothetical protein